MNKLQLLRVLRKHIKLAEKRSVAYEQNKIAKLFLYIGGAFIIVYLMFIAIILALIANNLSSYTPYELLFGLAPFLLVADFIIRFIGQQTPVQLIKPYSLLPISKYACVEMFIYSSVITPNNLLWTAVTVPYAIMTVLFSEGVFAALGVVVSFQVLVTINSQWYMLVRTLINQTVKWWVLPVVFYALVFMPLYLKDIGYLFNFYSSAGDGFAYWHPLNYLLIIFVLAAFVELNKRVQYHFTYVESSGTEKTKMKNVSELRAFDRYGEIGEYLKLETKSLMRNKNLRKSFMFATIFVIMLSLVISFTDLYEDDFFTVFWIVYIFVLYGSIQLIKIMSAEGNYIDCLMIHKENIIQLLRAKYYFYTAILFLPLLLMLPTVFMGKYSLLALLSMMCFTAGPVYCLLMQMAVYNRQTIPLNTKFISKGNVESNYFQVIAELVAMFFPVMIISILKGLLSEDLVFIVLLVVGLAFILTHKLWIRNIYKRFMVRRYKNMCSFRATK